MPIRSTAGRIGAAHPGRSTACQGAPGDGREIGERDGIRLDTANNLCQSVLNPADVAAEGFFDEVAGMLETFGIDATRSHLLTSTTE